MVLLIQPMTHPVKKYLEENEISQSEFGRRIGFDRVTVNRVVNGGKFSVDFMKAVIAETGGVITANDFFNSEKAA